MTTEARHILDAHISERDLQSLVIDFARLHGWRPFWTWNSRHSPKGWPDLVLLRDGRMIVAELKAEHGRLTVDQGDTLMLLRQVPGLEVYVWRPSDWDAIVAVLTREPRGGGSV